MGNVFFLSTLFSFLGLKRQQNPYQHQQPQSKHTQKLSQPSYPSASSLSQKQLIQKTYSIQTKEQTLENHLKQQKPKLETKNHNQTTKQTNSNQTNPFQFQQPSLNPTQSLPAQRPEQQSQILINTDEQQKLQQNITDFIFLAKPNENILYHNPTLPNPKIQKPTQQPTLTNDELQELFDKNLYKFDGVKPSDGKKEQNSQKLAFEFQYQTRHIGFSHNIMIGEKQVKWDVHKSKLVILIKEGILDLKDKNLSRLHEIFNLKVLESRDELQRVLQQEEKLLEDYPAYIICHYSLFELLHKEYLHDFRVAKISIFNCSLVNPSIGNNVELINYDQQHKFSINSTDPTSKVYKKLGIVQTKIYQLRQSLIQLMVLGQINPHSQSIFAQYRFFNQEYVSPKEMGLRSCLKLQEFPKQVLLTINQEALLQQKLKAKLDLISLLQNTLRTEFYLEYIASLLRQEPKWVVKNKQQLKTEYEKIEEILKPIKNYKLLPFYENHFQIDKQQIRTLEQIDQLKLLPSTNVQIFWEVVEKLLFPQNSSVLCVSLISNYLTYYKSPMELQSLRLYVSDLFVSIRQLYKHYDQKLYEGQVYCTLNLNDKQLDFLRNTMTAESTGKRLDKVKPEKRIPIIQNENFLIASKSKQKQISKQGNVLLQIIIKKQRRTYHIDYGFISRQKKKQNNKAKHSKSSQQLPSNQEDGKLVINILNTFYIESVQYHSESSKYIVKLTYGYVPAVSLKMFTNHLGMTEKQKVIAECYLNNQNHFLANIYTQGDALYYSKMYDQSQVFFEEFLIKAKRQPRTNLLKISYAFMGQYRALLKKKLYHKAQEELFKSTSTLQKIFGQRCHQAWNNILLQVEIYQMEGHYERGVQRISTLLSLIKSKAFEIERKPNHMMEQNLQVLSELEAVVNMKIGVLYMKAGKQDLSQRYMKKAIDTANKSIGEFNPLTAEIYERMREFYIKYEDYEKAVFNAKKALAINLNIRGEHSIVTASSYRGVGLAHFYNKENELSLKNLISALSIMEELYSQDHNQIIELYREIGNTLHKNKSFKQAIRSYERGHFLVRHKQSPQQAKILNELNYLMGLSFKEQGNYIQAIQKFQQSNSLSLHILCPNHQQQAQSFKQMAQIYEKQGKYEKAISLYEKPLVSIIRNKGKSSKDTIWYYEKLGHLYMHLSKNHQNHHQHQSNVYLSKALDYFNRIIQLRLSSSRLSFETASSYDNIGNAYLIKHDHQHALHYFIQSLNIKKELIQNQGEDQQQHNLDFSISFYLIGCAYFTAKDYENSIQYLQKSLTIKTKKLSQTHPQIALIYKKLAQNHTKINNFQKAQQFYKKTLTIYLSLYGPTHPETSYIHYLISSMFFEKSEIAGKSLDHIIKAMQTIKDLGLSQDHHYHIKYTVKLKEILHYLIKRMNQQEVEPQKMLQELRSIFYNLKLIGFQDKIQSIGKTQAVDQLQSKLKLQNLKLQSPQKPNNEQMLKHEGKYDQEKEWQLGEIFGNVRAELLKLEEKLLDIAERQLTRDRASQADDRRIGQIIKALIQRIQGRTDWK